MLEFFEDKHIYLLDGEPVPCVSEILRFIHSEVYTKTDKKAMDKAANRGTRIHRACEEIDRKGITECDTEILQYVSAYVQFLKDHDVTWELIETPLLYTMYPCAYAGTLDRYGVVDGKKMLIDIKSTRSITKKHQLLYATQLTAYSWADRVYIDGKESWKHRGVDSMAILQLKPDGTYKLIEVNSEDDLWMACLTMHNKFYLTTKRKKVSK